MSEITNVVRPEVAASLDNLRYLVFEGMKGEDGFSPTVTITDITGGHRVTITDEDGAHTFDVMDGEDGSGDVAIIDIDDEAIASYNGSPITGGGIADLIEDGKTVIGNVQDLGSYLCRAVYINNVRCVMFTHPWATQLHIITFGHDSSEGDPQFYPYLNPLPTVTSSDNGKILKVVNGVWTAVDPNA